MKSRTLLFTLGLLAIFSLSSCLQIVEELFLKKDGSGTYTLTIDMSSLMKDEFLKSMLTDAAYGEEGFLLPGEPMELDTIIPYATYFSEDAGISSEVWKESFSSIVISEKEAVMEMKVHVAFEKLSDIAGLLSSAASQDETVSGITEGGILDAASLLFALDKKNFSRSAGEKPDLSSELQDEGTIGMMQMMLADAMFTSIYHMPGKIKKSNMKDATIDGSTLTIQYPVMDILLGNIQREGNISFK